MNKQPIVEGLSQYQGKAYFQYADSWYECHQYDYRRIGCGAPSVQLLKKSVVLAKLPEPVHRAIVLICMHPVTPVDDDKRKTVTGRYVSTHVHHDLEHVGWSSNKVGLLVFIMNPREAEH